MPLIEAHLGFSKIKPFTAIKPVGRMPMGGVVMEQKPLLIESGYESATADALIEHLNTLEIPFHWADVSGIPIDSKMPAAWWKNEDKQKHMIDNSYFLLPLPEKMEMLLAGLSRNTKESLRKMRKSFKDLELEGHKIDFKVVTEPNDVQEALRVFFELHTSRSEMQNVTAHPNYYPTAQHQEFLKNVAQDALAGSFQIAELKIDGKTEASRIILKAGKDLYLFSSGFNPAFWDHAIMRKLTTEIIGHAMADPEIENVNLSVGKDPNKLSWKPEEHLIGRIRFEPNGSHEMKLYQMALFLGMLRGRPV